MSPKTQSTLLTFFVTKPAPDKFIGAKDNDKPTGSTTSLETRTDRNSHTTSNSDGSSSSVATSRAAAISNNYLGSDRFVVEPANSESGGEDVVAGFDDLVDQPPENGLSSFGASETSTASRRTMRDGREIVMESDSDERSLNSLMDDRMSDMDLSGVSMTPRTGGKTAMGIAPLSEDVDDDDSFAELDSILFAPIPASTGPVQNKAASGSFYSPLKRGDPKTPKLAHDLRSLVAMKAEAEASAKRLAATKFRIDSGRLMAEQGLLSSSRGAGQPNFDSDSKNTAQEVIVSTLESVFSAADRTDEINRAMERTNVFEKRVSWSFFKRDLGTATTRTVAGPDILASNIRSIKRLGYLLHYTKVSPPDESISQALFTLAHRRMPADLVPYIKTIVSSATPGQIHRIVTKDMIIKLFENLGARPEALDIYSPIPVEYTSNQASKTPVSILVDTLLGIFPIIARHLSDEAREAAILLISRLSADESVYMDPSLSVTLSSALDVAVQSVSMQSSKPLLERLFDSSNTSPILQERIILLFSSLRPTRSTVEFRRRLSLALALNDRSLLESDLTNPELTTKVIDYLRNPTYFPRSGNRRQADYVSLAANSFLAELAVAAGFSTFSFIKSSRSSAAASVSPPIIIDLATPPAAALFKKPLARPRRDLSEGELLAEKELSCSVWELSTAVAALATRIIDSGAQDLARTECKTGLELWQSRLEQASHVPDHRKKNWWDGILRKKLGDVSDAGGSISSDQESTPGTLPTSHLKAAAGPGVEDALEDVAAPLTGLPAVSTVPPFSAPAPPASLITELAKSRKRPRQDSDASLHNDVRPAQLPSYAGGPVDAADSVVLAAPPPHVWSVDGPLAESVAVENLKRVLGQKECE